MRDGVVLHDVVNRLDIIIKELISIKDSIGESVRFQNLLFVVAEIDSDLLGVGIELEIFGKPVIKMDQDVQLVRNANSRIFTYAAHGLPLGTLEYRLLAPKPIENIFDDELCFLEETADLMLVAVFLAAVFTFIHMNFRSSQQTEIFML